MTQIHFYDIWRFFFQILQRSSNWCQPSRIHLQNFLAHLERFRGQQCCHPIQVIWPFCGLIKGGPNLDCFISKHDSSQADHQRQLLADYDKINRALDRLDIGYQVMNHHILDETLLLGFREILREFHLFYRMYRVWWLKCIVNCPWQFGGSWNWTRLTRSYAGCITLTCRY